ncbi:MAG: energy-coupled thiamine transporter ThiT [Fretibacterium sp.]|nr:energy-coupled thiamine transporter ThiT [Fretibacterium sp.]
MSSSPRSTIVPMVEGALCIALAEALSKVNLFLLPQGGSLDLGLAPLLLFAWRRGMKWGCGVGALAGIVKILLGGYILNPLQAVLDYPIAYACTGLAAIFPWGILGRIIGVILAAMGQIGCHVASGAIFFAQYAPEGQDPWLYSLAYNVPIISLKYAASTIAAWLLWRALEKVLPSGRGRA